MTQEMQESPDEIKPAGWFTRTKGNFYDTFGILSDPVFRWYWFATFGYYTGLRIEELARGWLAYDMTKSAMMLGLVIISQGLPHAIIGAIGGTLADRIPKRTLLIWMQALLAGNAFVMWLLLVTGNAEYWHVVVIAIIHGTGVGLSLPARLSYVAEVVRPDQFVRAYGLYYVALNTMRIGGPALGGLLVVWVGMSGAYFAIVGMHLWSFFAMFRVHPQTPPPTPSGKSFISDLAAAFAFARRTRFLLILLGSEIGKAMCVSPSRQLMPVFAGATVFAVGAGGLGTLQAALGAGALAGSVVAAVGGGIKRKTLALMVVGALEGLVLVMFANSPVFLMAIVCIGVFGTGTAIYTTLESTLFQLSATPDMRGRVMGLRMMSSAIEPLGVLPLSYLADVVGARFAVSLAGVIVVFFMFGLGTLFPDFRKHETEMPAGGVPARSH